MRRRDWAVNLSAPQNPAIAPFYSDKYAKIGFQVSELFGEESDLRDKVNSVIEMKNVLIEHLYHKEPLDPDEIFKTAAGVQRDGAPLCVRYI